MIEIAAKSPKENSHWVSNAHSPNSNHSRPTFQFADRRATSSAHRNTQHIIQQSSKVNQLRAFQAKANKNQPVIQRSASGNQVIQLMGSDDLETLFKHVKKGNKEGFKQKFRSIDPGMDEQISCQVTFEHARQMLQQGKSEQDVKDFLEQSDKVRLPTEVTAHDVEMKDGSDSKMIHPTSENLLLYNTDYTAKGNPRWTKHTSFDRARSKHVRGGTDTQDMIDRAIEFTLANGSQPPFAKNSHTKLSSKFRRYRKLHRQRERLKMLHSSYDPKAKQKYNRRWEPNKFKRGVSPTRNLPRKKSKTKR